MPKHISRSKREKSARKLAARIRILEEIRQEMRVNYEGNVLDNLRRQEGDGEGDGEGSGRKVVQPPAPACCLQMATDRKPFRGLRASCTLAFDRKDA